MRPYFERNGITIYLGDCREVLPTLEVGSVDLVLTDPPYGIGFDTDFRRFGERSNRIWERIRGDSESFDPSHLLSIGRCVLFGANYFADRLPLGQWIIWNKRDSMKSDMVLADAEMLWHNCGGRSVQVFNWYWNGCYRKGEMGSALHPSQKPLALMSWLVETIPANLILDPYVGSGTTLVAAKMLGRRAIGIEIEERYCEIAARRLDQEVLPLPSAPTASHVQAALPSEVQP